MGPYAAPSAYLEMALHRAVSFPLSQIEEESRIPPFDVSKKDVLKLQSCEAFQLIRDLLLNKEEAA